MYEIPRYALLGGHRGSGVPFHSQYVVLCTQKATVRFENNSAGRAGAAIYANDMSRCKWLGPTNYTSEFIFNAPLGYDSPFTME